jgi:hypothetical protein
VGAFNAKLYPHQSPAHAEVFYRHLDAFLKREFPHAVLLDFLSLTREGLSKFSDEFHSMTDVNMIKTMIVLHSMKLKLEEKKKKNRLRRNF